MEDYVSQNWRALVKPGRVERHHDSTETYGKFQIRPFERGFGTTIGNALRRVLLSSLQGAAITSVKIEGVEHEFSYIPGIIEDVADIVLNLKGVRIRTKSLEAIRGKVRVEGQLGETVIVRAGDFTFDAACEVLNPELPICTLTEDAVFEAEVTVGTGKGYRPASAQDESGAPLGTIQIDSIFSPIRRVRYSVNNARVGQHTDFDRLTLEIWTDGAVTPEDALAYSAKVLKEQLQVFINFVEEEEPATASARPEEQSYNEHLNKRVDELELSVRSQNCLQNAGIEYIWQLVERTEPEMMKTKNFGRKSLNEIKEILGDFDLSLGMKLHNFPKPKLG